MPNNIMETIKASIGLSSLAMDLNQGANSPNMTLSRVKHYLNGQFDLMGHFIKCKKIAKQRLDKDLQLEQYELAFEKRSLHMQFLFFKPRGTWEVKGFSFA